VLGIPVCAWHCLLVYAALTSPISVLTLNGGTNMPDDIPTPTLGGVIGCERGQPNRGHPRPTAADGGTVGVPDVGGAYIGGTGISSGSAAPG
jgi:hypothetical protein